MRPLKHIDPKQLKQELLYDPDTGLFVRLHNSPCGRVPAGFVHKPKQWDTYVRIRLGAHYFAAHRLAYVYMTGRQPQVVDHINGLRHDNRWENLRDGTHTDNSKNRKSHRIAAGTYIPHPD